MYWFQRGFRKKPCPQDFWLANSVERECIIACEASCRATKLLRPQAKSQILLVFFASTSSKICDFAVLSMPRSLKTPDGNLAWIMHIVTDYLLMPRRIQNAYSLEMRFLLVACTKAVRFSTCKARWLVQTWMLPIDKGDFCSWAGCVSIQDLHKNADSTGQGQQEQHGVSLNQLNLALSSYRNSRKAIIVGEAAQVDV